MNDEATDSVPAQDEPYTPETEQVRSGYIEARWEAFPSQSARSAVINYGPDFDRRLAAHDAVIRADQAENDARIAEGLITHRVIAQAIRRLAVDLTPTTEETEQ